jgi:hypothetical protein
MTPRFSRLQNRKDEFLSRFVGWIRESKFARLLVLGSLDGSNRADNLGDKCVGTWGRPPWRRNSAS